MSQQPVQEKLTKAQPVDQPRIVNDFSMVVATVNGSGSQTSNMALIRALFRMGVPVSGKSLFPSNIQGLPTWFTIRASSLGYTARREKVEIVVAMNPATFLEDLQTIVPGGVCFHPDNFPAPGNRDDVVYYPMPVQSLVKEIDPPKELREYISNMAYVGIVASALGIELEEIRKALFTHFRGKERAVESNMNMIGRAHAWAEANLTKRDPYIVQRDHQTEGMILVDGNTAGALGSIYGGVSFSAWYPITPASSLPESLTEYLPKLRKEKDTGKATYAVVQAEDEIAAAGMAVGAGWMGARSMTATSGPGLSLMAEYVGLAFFVEVPVVIWDVQRMGPGTGLPTRTSQGDVMFVRYLGHGDTKHILLFPATPAECFEFGWRAFDLAERLQTPVFVMSDLDLGMNTWMSEAFEYPEEPMDRGKVLDADDLAQIGVFGRYRDVEGDGIAYRTLPGNPHPLATWFARGTGHNENALYSERAEDWASNMERLWRKLDTARDFVPRPVLFRHSGAHIGLIGYGSTDPAIQEARDRLSAAGVPTNYLRLRSIPFTLDVRAFIEEHDEVYVIEMNTDGQMRQLLQLEVPEHAAKLRSLSYNTGLPLSARWIVANVRPGKEG
jgi:2-oxoglutarate ferredoxin oxidoreductase subunit alpha